MKNGGTFGWNNDSDRQTQNAVGYQGTSTSGGGSSSSRQTDGSSVSAEQAIDKLSKDTKQAILKNFKQNF